MPQQYGLTTTATGHKYSVPIMVNDAYHFNHDDVKDLVLSFNRHKVSKDDSSFSCQLALNKFGNVITEQIFEEIIGTVQDQLNVSLHNDKLTIVSRNPESGILSFVNWADELAVDIMTSDRKNVQFYLVKNDNITNLPQV